MSTRGASPLESPYFRCHTEDLKRTAVPNHHISAATLANSGHRPGGSQLRDPFGRKPENVPQNFIGVLPQDWRRRGYRLPVGRKPDRTVHYGNLAQCRMLGLHYHFTRDGLRLRQSLLNA
jgi:hypothetical protein